LADSFGLSLSTIGLLPLMFAASDPRLPGFGWMSGGAASPCFWMRS
jgi:hypothetical protein